MSKQKGYIYKIKNTINDKLYIGQTIRSLDTRFVQHCRDAMMKDYDSNIKLYNAMKKYGPDKFSIELVEECDMDELNEREIFWIKYYDSYHNGYNTTLGGSGKSSDFSKEILQEWENGLIAHEISKKTGHAHETVIHTLLRNGIAREEIKKRAYKSQSSKVKVPIYQYDLDGNFIKEYASIWDAQKETRIHHGCINGVLCNKHHTAGNYQWRREKHDKIEPVSRQHAPGPKPVCQYDLDGNFIKEYPSITSAAINVGLMSILPIRRVCNGKANASVGYKWAYASA